MKETRFERMARRDNRKGSENILGKIIQENEAPLGKSSVREPENDDYGEKPMDEEILIKSAEDIEKEEQIRAKSIERERIIANEAKLMRRGRCEDRSRI